MSETTVAHYFSSHKAFAYCLDTVRRLARSDAYYERVLNFLEQLDHENTLYDVLTYKQRNWLMQIVEDLKDEIRVGESQEELFKNFPG